MLYFAYGSNLNQDRLFFRIGEFKKVTNYTLNGYDLVFNTGTGKQSFANIVKHKDSKVEGVIYEITQEQEYLLDRYEGVNQGIYRKEYVTYMGEYMLIYTGKIFNNLKPGYVYLDVIIQGCDEHGLISTAQKLRDVGKRLYPWFIFNRKH